MALCGFCAAPAYAQSLWGDPGSRLSVVAFGSVAARNSLPAVQTRPLPAGMLSTFAIESTTVPSVEDRRNYWTSGALPPGMDDVPRSRWLGAATGGVAGSALTYVVLNSGVDSTQICNQSANQDSVETRYCVGLYIVGGLAGAGVGWLVSKWIADDS